jgi:putative transposase
VTFALDCCDREIVIWVATTKGIDAGLVGDLMMQAVEDRFGSNGKPHKTIERLTDNGSRFTVLNNKLCKSTRPEASDGTRHKYKK